MHKLQKLLKDNPDVTNINLQYENIRDLTLSMLMLKKFPNLIGLSLHGNKLKMLPLMPNLQLTHLDVSKNPLEIDNYLLDSLYSLVTLENLKIDGNEKELERIVENLPNLKFLNNHRVLRQRKLEPGIELMKKMLTNLYSERQKIQQLSKDSIQKFEVFELKECDYSSSFTDIINEYRQFSDNVMNDKAKEGIFIYSKNRVLDLAMDTLMVTLQANGFEYISDIVMSYDQIRKEHFDSILKIVLQVGYDECCLEDDLGEELNSEMKNLKLRKERLYLKEIMRLKKKLSEYRSYLNKSDEENQKLLGILYSLTKGEINKVVGETKTSRNQPRAIDLLKKRERDPTPKHLNTSKSAKKIRSSRGDLTTVFKKEEQKLKQETEDKSSILNLEQTLKLIDEIVIEKQRHNDACVTRKDAFATGEQFLTIFFTKKYGIKNVAASWSIKFIRSLDFYSKQNTLCQAFLKILKNSMEESFYQQHKQFMGYVEKMLAEYLQDENIRYGEAQLIFKKLLPEEEIKYIRKVEDLSSISPKEFKEVLHIAHISIHERLLEEFKEVFNRFDTEGTGVLTLTQAKDFVEEFFRPKVERMMVGADIPEKVIKKLDPFKKNRVLFSELVSTVDKI